MNQFINFILAGIIAVGIRLIITPFCNLLLGMSLNISYAIALAAVVLYGFFMNYQVIFRNRENPKIKFFVYVLSIMFFSFIDWSIVTTLSSFIPYYLIVVPTTGVIFILKYIFYKKIIFVDWTSMKYIGNLKSKNPFKLFIYHKLYCKVFDVICANQGKTFLNLANKHLGEFIVAATLMKTKANGKFDVALSDNLEKRGNAKKHIFYISRFKPLDKLSCDEIIPFLFWNIIII